MEPPNSCLLSRRISALIEWVEIDRQFDGSYVSPQAKRGWQPTEPIKSSLLAIWHDLSDVKLQVASADRASIHRFWTFPSPGRAGTHGVRAFPYRVGDADWTGHCSTRGRQLKSKDSGPRSGTDHVQESASLWRKIMRAAASISARWENA
jgi:hypothetical protein